MNQYLLQEHHNWVSQSHKCAFDVLNPKLMHSGSSALGRLSSRAGGTLGFSVRVIVIFRCNFRMIRFAQIQEKLHPVFWLVLWVAGSREHTCCTPARRHFGFASHLSFSFAVTGSVWSYSIETSQWCDLKLTALKKAIFFWPSDHWVLFLVGSISDIILSKPVRPSARYFCLYWQFCHTHIILWYLWSQL